MQRHEMIHEMMRGHSARYWRVSGRIQNTDVMRRTREWFEDWHRVLEEQYLIAVNDADNIIGKQWHYDNGLRLARLQW